MARRHKASRPEKPAGVCEVCGAEVVHVWSLHGRCWIPLESSRYPMDGPDGTYEVWRDHHGGLLAAYLAPGERGIHQQPWRGQHHNAVCGTWRRDMTRQLVRESLLAIPGMNEAELVLFGQRLTELQKRVDAALAGAEPEENHE